MVNQSYLQLSHLLIFILSGIIISVSFDIFRIFRKTFKTSNFITTLEDIIFWIITGFFLICVILRFNNGEIRGYILFGLLIGISFYLLTISKYFIKCSVIILEKMKGFVFLFLKLSKKTYKKIIYKPIYFLVINFKKIWEKLLNFGKKSWIK